MTAGVAARPRVSRKSPLTAAARPDAAPASAAEYEARIAALEAELREALEQQTATADILRVIASTPGDPSRALDTIAETAARIFGASNVGIRRLDGDMLRLISAAGPVAAAHRQQLPDAPFDPATGIGQCVAENRQLHFDDLAARSLDGHDAAGRLTQSLGIRVAALTPLTRDGRAIGVLIVHRSEPRPFRSAELDLMRGFADQAVIAIENARLLVDLRERTGDLQESLEYQTATNDVLQVISRSAFDLQPVLDTLIETAARLCGAEKAILYRHENGAYRFAAGYSTEPEYERIERVTPIYPGEGTVAGRAALHHRAVRITDALADPLYEQKEAARVGKARSMIGVPMLRDGSPIGVIALARERVEPFTDRQIELVQTFADQAVIAIENARLMTETREALEQQTATAEVLQVIDASPGDLQPVFEAIVEKAHSLCDATFGALMIFDGERFRTVAAHNVPEPFKELVREGLRPTPLNPFGRLMRGEPFVHVDDLAEAAAHVPSDPTPRVAFEVGGIRTQLVVPLRKDDKLLGVITANRGEVRPFTAAQIALLQNFAAQAVIAMENARLITETRVRSAELQEALEYQTATSDVLNFISRSTFDLTPVLEYVIETAIRLCRAHMGSVFRLEDGVYRWAAGCGLEPEYREIEMRTPISPGTGTLVGRVALEGRTVQIADAEADPLYAVKDEARITRARTMLGVPLLRDGAGIGVIAMARDRVELFNDKEIALVTTFADQAVIAIENVRLITETRGARDAAEAALRDLKATQSSLIQAQKMAALGQLTAGIAHEIKNPLNFVNNFAGLSVELLDELKETAGPVLAAADNDTRAGIDETIEMLTGNLEKIAEHGKRADGIVRSMLEHSRGVTGERREVDLNGLVEEALNLAYHGARAQDAEFNITLERDFAIDLAPIEIVPQDVTRVFLNLIGNGFHAAHKRLKEAGDGSFRPVLKVTTRDLAGAVEVRVRDNGTGIPLEHRDKLFQPFFTTKPTGEGTGLGLSISYDIVTQQHGGRITVDSEVGSFTEFAVRLPRAKT